MDYTLKEVHRKVQQFLDKMGSDYFQVPVMLDYFETATLEFVGEKLRIIEKTQEVVDDIRRLVVPGKLTVQVDPNDSSRYIAALPVEYMRLVSYDVFYKDGSRCRKADLKRQAEYIPSLNNPNAKPTWRYPILLQESDLLQVDCGGENTPDYLKIMYCKKPKFATPAKMDDRIVNLSDEAIENIMLMTVTRIYGNTADQRTKTNYELEEAFRKEFK